MGWCPVEMKCNTSPEVWKYLIEQDASRAKWVNTPFPLFNKMEALVGKILASAEDTFDPTQPTPVSLNHDINESSFKDSSEQDQTQSSDFDTTYRQYDSREDEEDFLVSTIWSYISFTNRLI
jgi:hypothetical protein